MEEVKNSKNLSGWLFMITVLTAFHFRKPTPILKYMHTPKDKNQR